jgi:predicted PurR-regulated permease PerM
MNAISDTQCGYNSQVELSRATERMQKRGQLIEQIAAVIAVVLLIGGCLVILAPFFAPLLWAAIISFCTWNIYMRLVRALRGRRGIAAFILMLCALICVVGPFSYAIVGLVGQASTFGPSGTN